MSSYRICGTCQTWVWFDERHVCPPLWLVGPEDSPETMRSVYASDSEEAAKKWAETYDADDCEYYLAKGNEMVVLVGRAGADLVRVSVEGETVPSYRARELGPAIYPPENSPSGGAHDASTKTDARCDATAGDAHNHSEGEDR